MLDLTTYRMYQELAKNNMPSWRLYERHQVEFLSLSMLPQLRTMLDTMHEGRFDDFMNEMGGFTTKEKLIFLNVCKEVLEFQNQHFPNKKLIVPLNSLIATFCVYQKIKKLSSGFRSLMEIGPGCGYLPFFLRADHPQLENYTQIEAAESFYLLQHHINRFVYGSQFDQKVYCANHADADFYGAEYFDLSSQKDVRMDSLFIDLPEKSKVVHQYPWWQIGRLMSSRDQFDIIMSNANLMEFNRAALEDYLTLIYARLSPNGLFFVQCFGGGPDGGLAGIPEALRILKDFGYRPLFLAYNDGINKLSPKWLSDDNYLNSNPKIPRKFALPNGLFISKKHELYNEYDDIDNFNDCFYARLPNIRNAFFDSCEDKTVLNKKELIDSLKGQL